MYGKFRKPTFFGEHVVILFVEFPKDTCLDGDIFVRVSLSIEERFLNLETHQRCILNALDRLEHAEDLFSNLWDFKV